MERDRLSALDDDLLCCHILSCLPLKEAVRCSLLSRRWRYLWTLIPHLKVTNLLCEEIEQQSVIENIMFFHSVEIQSFELALYHHYPPQDPPEKLNQLFRKWVGFASLKRVKQITLSNFGLPVHVPATLFMCEHLTFLKLVYFKFKRRATFFRGFRHLITCYLSNVYINDDKLKLLVEDCPLLENLTVEGCEGLSNVEILAGNLKYLNFIDNNHLSSMKVSCPRLENMIVDDYSDLCWFELNNCGDLQLCMTDFITDVPSLKVLNGFSGLEELHIESEYFEAASEELGSLTLALKDLKKVHVKIFSYSEDEIGLLGCLLRSAPSLQKMKLTLPICPQNVHKERFLQQLLGLKGSSKEATVPIKTEMHGEHCKKCFPS